MGCGPSAELLSDAPFRPPQGGVRQVALIPIVERFFPTPDCALFRQLYEAYTDPSVRYYVRANFDDANGDLSRIPDVVNSRAELHQLLLELTNRGMFATNADVRAAYARGEGYRIRPILCAVVFLYEGANYVPEGSVQLPTHGRSPSVFVKVIGVVGDTASMLRRVGDPPVGYTTHDTLKMQTLITKSAGDHNMSRVVLLAAYIYYHQCVEIIGLPKTPSMAASFTCFKTNIPFLCFLREMRDRTASVLDPPKDSKFYIDEHCLHGAVTQDYVDTMMPAFARYFVSFLNAKSEQRLVKQLAHQQRANGLAKEASPDSKSSSASAHPIGCLRGSDATKTGDAASLTTSPTSTTAAVDASKQKDVAPNTNANGNNAAPKVTYIVKGYLTRPHTSLSAWSCAPNEVYVTCVDGTVTVVDRRSVDAVDGPTHTPTLGLPGDEEEIEEERGVPTSARAVVETFAVRRGDILSFHTPSSSSHPDAADTPAEEDAPPQCVDDDDDVDDNESTASSQARFLRLNTDDDDDSASSSRASSSFAKPHHKRVTLRKGSWRIDDSIFIESVLLSLVRDECKLAREASVDDPRWVHDDVKNCPVHDGSFYVWHFRRGRENFFYGTVPKFANTNRPQGRGGGALGTRALRNTGVRVGKGGMLLEPPALSAASGAMRLQGSGVAGVSQPPLPPPQLPQHNRFGLPVVFPSCGEPAESQPQQRPPSYIAAANAAPSTNTSVQLGNVVPGGGPVYVFQNSSGGVSTIAPAGQCMYNLPYLLPNQAAQLSAVAPPGMPPAPYGNAHGVPLTPAWLSMGGSSSAPAPHRGPGDFNTSTSFSVGSNVSSMANAPAPMPYVMNAQGQLVPWPGVMLENPSSGIIQPAATTPPAPPQAPSYVMINGQLCLLQPAPAAQPSPQFCMPFQQQQQQQQQFANSLVYLQRQ